MQQYIFLALAIAGVLTSDPVSSACCAKKTVGGIPYTIVDEADMSDYKCLTNCVYEKEDSPGGARFCFAGGYLEVICNEDTTASTITATTTATTKTNVTPTTTTTTIITTTTTVPRTTTSTNTTGVLITGGWGPLTSTVLYLPETGKTCSLQDLPDNRREHSIDNLAGRIILCGGLDTRTSCIEFLPNGTWAQYATLAQRRFAHSSFVSKGKLILMGGDRLPKTEIVGEGDHYSLQQNTYFACSIPDHESTILTGGLTGHLSYLSSVVRYDSEGYVENLPDLATARSHLGCGYYLDNGNNKVLVVAGGRSSSGYISSTEILAHGATAWSTGESLPRTLSGPASVNIDGYLLLIGGSDIFAGYRGEILKFNGTWTEVGKMANARTLARATKIEIPREEGFIDISACY